MPKSQLSVQSSKAVKLANVEQKRENGPDFYVRISREYGTKLDLEHVIRECRKANTGIDL